MFPENVYQYIKVKIKKEWIICFVSVIIFGLAAHGYRMLNNLPNWDALLNEYDSQNTIYLGRCFLSVVCGIGSYYELPWINGWLSLIYVGFTAILISEILEIKTRLALVLMSGILVTFPVVTSTFCYIYTADGYFLGCLLMALAVWMIVNIKRGWIWAMAFICLGNGIYQANITIAVILILLVGIRQQMFEKHPVGETICFLRDGMMSGVGGTVLYYLFLTVLMRLEGQSLSGYQNIESTYCLSQLKIPFALKSSLVKFVKFFVGDGSNINFYVILNILMLGLLAIFVLRRVWMEKLYGEPVRFMLIVLLHMLLPVGCFVLFLIAPYIDYHMLMNYGVCGIYLYFLMFYQQKSPGGKGKVWEKWAIAGVSVLIVYNFILIANISYHVLELSHEKSYNMIVRITDRLEQTEGWEECEYLAILGRQEGTKPYSVNFPPEITGITNGLAARENFNVQAMLKDYSGIEKKHVDEEREAEIYCSKEYKNMADWPEKDSVKRIDDVMVVKLGELY